MNLLSASSLALGSGTFLSERIEFHHLQDYIIHMNLSYERNRIGWTQTQLARYLGCHQSLIALWESGKQSPIKKDRDKMDVLFRGRVDWDVEFEPLDETEKRAALVLAGWYIADKKFEDAVQLIFGQNKYFIRKALKVHGFPTREDYMPAGSDEVLYPMEVILAQRKNRRTK